MCRVIIANAKRFGGTVVVNWHDRSLAPERLWGDCYRQLLDLLSSDNRPWFTTADRAVQWFLWRRSIRFSRICDTATDVTFEAEKRPAAVLPAALIRHRSIGSSDGPVEEQRFDGAGGQSLPATVSILN
jgi:hypothetical protein